jgi:hypothetical protein
MNEKLNNSIEKLLDTRDESQFDIYCELSNQLMKEFFIEQTHRVYLEADNPDSPFNDKGRIPTLRKLADWFIRFITRLKSWFVRKRMNKMVEKIQDMAIYKDHEGEPDYEYQVLLPNADWLSKPGGTQKVTHLLFGTSGSGTRTPGLWELYVYPDVQTIMRNLITPAGKLKNMVKQLNHVKDIAKEDWDEIKKITAINTDATEKTHIKHSVLSATLQACKLWADNMKINIEHAFSKKDNVKKVCDELISRSANDTEKENWSQISEQYVKFITDLLQVWLYMSQCQMRILERIHYSLGRPNAKKPDGV